MVVGETQDLEEQHLSSTLAGCHDKWHRTGALRLTEESGAGFWHDSYILLSKTLPRSTTRVTISRER